ncbi:MAG TPA: carbohydrate ABC transporter permease [bacterium]|nr:carbohydrate ABC transporter permease [bacterium]
MNSAHTPESILRRVGLALAVLVIVLVFLAPYEWLVASAFKPYADIFSGVFSLSVWTFVPRRPTLVNFIAVFRDQAFGRYVFNSLLVAGAQVVGTVLVSTVAAFVLARVRFPGRNLVFGLVLVMLLIPFDAIVIPLFTTVRTLHLQDTYWGFFLPWIFSPFGIFFLKQVFEELPTELDEAAIMDGASPLRVLTHVVVPNVLPGLATLALFTFLFAWDAFYWPLVVMSDDTKQLITVFIAKQTTSQTQFWGNLFAASAVATIPVIALFVWLQRYYVRGIMTTGLKD